MNGLKTEEFYRSAKIGEYYQVSDGADRSYPFNRGEVIRYVGVNLCDCSYRGCEGKGIFEGADGTQKHFCMAWLSKPDGICQWTFLQRIGAIDYLEEDLFEI